MKSFFSEHLLLSRVSSYYIPDVLDSFTPINVAPPGVKWYIISRKSVNTIKFDVLRQEESNNLSQITTWGVRRRFEQGKVTVNHTKFLGYDKDADGNLVINEKQAKIVRHIFEEYLNGKGTNRIARELEREKIKGATGASKMV